MAGGGFVILLSHSFVALPRHTHHTGPGSGWGLFPSPAETSIIFRIFTGFLQWEQ